MEEHCILHRLRYVCSSSLMDQEISHPQKLEILVKPVPSQNNPKKRKNSTGDVPGRFSKRLHFLPGLRSSSLLEHNNYLQVDAAPSRSNPKKTKWMHSGNIHWACHLNKRAFLLEAEDIPIVCLDIKNKSNSRVVRSIEFKLFNHMRVSGWSWEGVEMAQNRRVRVPLLQGDRPDLNLQPGEEKGIFWPLYIDPNTLPKLPPSFRGHAIGLRYILIVTLHISGSSDAECKLPLKFLLPEPVSEELAKPQKELVPEQEMPWTTANTDLSINEASVTTLSDGDLEISSCDSDTPFDGESDRSVCSDSEICPDPVDETITPQVLDADETDLHIEAEEPSDPDVSDTEVPEIANSVDEIENKNTSQ